MHNHRLLIFAPIMLTLLFPALCRAGKVRHYYIAAEDVRWDYAPSGRDLMHGRRIPAPWRNRTQWDKTRYIEYTDSTFSVRKPQPAWLGILGPIIRAEVGDTIVVEFLNRTRQPHSMHPHGVRYDKANEGAHYLPAGAGASVRPGQRFTYRWLADATSGPGPAERSSIVWWYHSHVEAEREINGGLLGPLIITARGKANADGTPKDVDSEFIAMFMIFNEQSVAPLSPGIAPSMGHTHGDISALLQPPPTDADLFHTINGYLFGNLNGFTMSQGDRVRWYLLGMGSEQDLHTPHWHGQVVAASGRHTDVVELLPGSMATVDMIADNPGTWQLHCHVLDHMEAGMMATYTVLRPKRACPVSFESGNFWDSSGKFSVTVRNSGNKDIRSVVFLTSQFFGPLDLRPFLSSWPAVAPLSPGQEQTLEMKDYFRDPKALLGWVFNPVRVLYQDGSEWLAQERGECFKVFWRDKDHPDVTVLPPLQLEKAED